MNETENWENLKSKILEVSGMEIIEPADCKMLVSKIYKKTNKTLSETTIKRIFGFAAANFGPSVFTKNVLAQYCGQPNWKDFLLSLSAQAAGRRNRRTSWEKLKEQVNKVNFFMLSAVKNKALIPFNEMIHREFIIDHFNAFANDGSLATVISAPTGYGKTIAVCQWINHKLDLQYQNDLILYFNSSFLLSSLKNEVSLSYWMMKMIGLDPSNNFNTLVFNQKNVHGKFYLIIDGFDELMFRKNQFGILLHLLQDLISLYSASTWFKIVVIMRDSTWLDWRGQLILNRDSWFLGDMNDSGQNVDLFTPAELQTLFRMKRPFTPQETRDENFSLLRYPLFHQLFYKKFHSVIQYEQYNERLIYDLATDYVVQNIVQGNQSINKMDFIFNLLRLAEFISGMYQIDKSRIELKHLTVLTTYSTLIKIGFLRESEKLSALNKRVYIKFGHQHFLACCIAAYLLSKDADFHPLKLEYIEQCWSKELGLKINILKWCLYQCPSPEQREHWEKGFQNYLSAKEYNLVSDFYFALCKQK